MSKAFTREADEVPSQQVAVRRPQLPPGAKNYITQDGAERLRRRLRDLREKSEFARADQAESHGPQGSASTLDPELRKLQSTLSSITEVEPPTDRERASFGAFVTVEYADGEKECLRIVGVDELEPERGYISWLSPLARALVSHRAGDTVYYDSPAGRRQLTILEVRYQ